MICETCKGLRPSGNSRNLKSYTGAFCSCYTLTDEAMKMSFSESAFYIITGNKLNKENLDNYFQMLTSGTVHKPAQ